MDDIKNRELFINAIMNSSLSSEEKKDFSELVARDLKGSEKKLSKMATKIKPHSPKDMVGFLYQFSRDEFFKWFTHDPEQTHIDYVVNYAKAEVNLQTAGFKRSINSQTFANIKNFICKTPYPPLDAFGGKIPFSWRDAILWVGKNPERNPFSDCLFDGKPFKEYVAAFKNTIEFRTDDDRMRFGLRLTDFLYNQCGLSHEITDRLDFIDESVDTIGCSLRAFIDVRMFFCALRQILKWIDEKKAISRLAFINLEASSDSYTLQVYHKGSYLDIDNTKIKGQDGDFEKVRKFLFSVADWRIEADRRYDGKYSPVQIDCLNSDTFGIVDNGVLHLSENKVTPLTREVGGVKHYIKFYKNTGE
jgi:hypothetical protein